MHFFHPFHFSFFCNFAFNSKLFPCAKSGWHSNVFQTIIVAYNDFYSYIYSTASHLFHFRKCANNLNFFLLAVVEFCLNYFFLMNGYRFVNRNCVCVQFYVVASSCWHDKMVFITLLNYFRQHPIQLFCC